MQDALDTEYERTVQSACFIRAPLSHYEPRPRF